MKQHTLNCRWEKTQPEESWYRETHHYCPHPEHACDCNKIETLKRVAIMDLIAKELDYAYTKHGRDSWGRHEFFAILKEEVDEVWDSIKKDESHEKLIPEIIQVAAMCFRYLETGDRDAK